jgi:hypothetical protein
VGEFFTGAFGWCFRSDRAQECRRSAWHVKDHRAASDEPLRDAPAEAAVLFVAGATTLAPWDILCDRLR